MNELRFVANSVVVVALYSKCCNEGSGISGAERKAERQRIERTMKVRADNSQVTSLPLRLIELPLSSQFSGVQVRVRPQLRSAPLLARAQYPQRMRKVRAGDRCGPPVSAGLSAGKRGRKERQSGAQTCLECAHDPMSSAT